ncbi:MAG: DNA replication/repair protein RecF [Anaerolineales bacterium]|nr:MAG: DNA replication/repair protein RecF [Anaerolineales bacterium]
MPIHALSLTNFRSYARLELTLPEQPLLLYGANAQGKTNLLEAIYVLATASSPLTSLDRELIRWQAEEEGLPYARIRGEVTSGTRSHEMEIVLEKRVLSNGSARTQKTIRVDRARKRRGDLAGLLTVVLFMPQDVALVSSSPATRRRHLDDVLCQVDADYCASLASYQNALRQRNATLRHLREGTGDRGQLGPFEEVLAAQGVLITTKRNAILEQLSQRGERLHQQLTAGAEQLRFEYQPGFDTAGEDNDAAVTKLRSALQARRPEEIARGITLVGPHRDEFRFLATRPANGARQIDVATYGSRGQQRTAVLALKLAELEWMKEQGRTPTLLLDEVMAEMDATRRDYLLAQVDGADQTILTATDPQMFSSEFRARATLWEVRDGLALPQAPAA